MTVRRKPAATPETLVAKEALQCAKAAPETPAVKRAPKCVVCGSPTTTYSTENLCWVCRRLKISAWGESDQQMPAQE